MTERAQGNWRTGEVGFGGSKTSVYMDDTVGLRIADCKSSGDGLTRQEARANAVLMAAAPDLLDALQGLEKHGHTKDTWATALTAIRKATKP